MLNTKVSQKRVKTKRTELHRTEKCCVYMSCLKTNQRSNLQGNEKHDVLVAPDLPA